MLFRKLRYYRWYYIGRRNIKNTILKSKQVKVVLGSYLTKYDGWISTDLPHFDVTKKSDWEFFFEENSIANLLAEHVLEHLDEKGVESVLKMAYQYLEPGGIFRIAVPDKNHPNPEYIEFVRPGGSGLGADDHKSFWDYRSLSLIAEKVGFKTTLLEYANDKKELITSAFSDENGTVKRSLSKAFKGDISNYSSLIIDLYKDKSSN